MKTNSITASLASPLSVGVLTIALFTSGLPTPAHATKQLLCDDPKANANIEFEMFATGGAWTPVIVPLLAADNQFDKARKIEAAVDALGGGWSADRPGGANLVVFKYDDGQGAGPKEIESVGDIKDYTGEKDKWTWVTADGNSELGFELSDGVASSRNSEGSQSLVTCLTSFGSATVYPRQGESSDSIVAALVADLQSDGVDLIRVWSRGFAVVDTLITYQVTDTALYVDGAYAVSEPLCNDIPGDVNCDGVINVLDVIDAINAAFRGAVLPPCCR